MDQMINYTKLVVICEFNIFKTGKRPTMLVKIERKTTAKR